MPWRKPITVATAAHTTDVCDDGAVQRRSGVLVVSDAIALVLFAVIGLTSHHKGLGVHGLVRDALPVLAGGFVGPRIAGAYRLPSWPPVPLPPGGRIPAGRL